MRIVKIWHNADTQEYEIEYSNGKTIRRKDLTKTQKEFIRNGRRELRRDLHLEWWF